MGTDIKAPKRSDEIVNPDNTPTLRMHRFMDEVTNATKAMPAIADISVSSTANNTTKINELLAALRTSGRLAT